MIIKTLKELDEKSPCWSAQLDPESALAYLESVHYLAAHFVRQVNGAMPRCDYGYDHSQNGAIAHTVTVGSDDGHRTVEILMNKGYNKFVDYKDLARTLNLIANVSGAGDFEAVVYNEWTFKAKVKW
jgi:hypothetical protein